MVRVLVPLGLFSYLRHCVVSFTQAFFLLLHCAWHRWCGMSQVAALPVTTTRYVVSCLPHTSLTFIHHLQVWTPPGAAPTSTEALSHA